jgi:spectinomycin phosphotransferase
VRDRPTGITERDVVRALADGWGLLAGEPRYTPAGGGSYHWMVTADQGDQWFVTVDDLDGKGWLGRTRPAAFAGLRTAMEAAVTLRDQAALAFVVAPVPALDGQAVRPLGDRHAMTVFPFLPGTPGRWDGGWPAADRAELVTMLAALHGADPAAAPLRRPGFGLSWRDALERALSELGRPWTGGPFDLRAPHRRTPGTEHAWRALEISIAKLNR